MLETKDIDTVKRLELTASKSGTSYYPHPIRGLDTFVMPEKQIKMFLSLSLKYYSGSSLFKQTRTDKSILTAHLEIDEFNELLEHLINSNKPKNKEVLFKIKEHFSNAKELGADFICTDLHQNKVSEKQFQ